MSAHDEKYSGACAIYAIDALDGADLQEFEAHLKEGCAACIAELSNLKEASALLPATLPQLSPPPELKERIEFSARLSQVVKSNIEKKDEAPAQQSNEQPEDEAVQKSSHRTVLTSILIAMIVMLIGFCVYIYFLFRTLDEQKDSSGMQQSLLAKSIEELERKNTILDILKSPNLELIQLSGTEINSDGYGQIIWDVDTHSAVLHTINLPIAPKDKEYKLWVSINHQPVVAQQCSFVSERGNEKYFKIKFAGSFSKNAVQEIFITLETKNTGLYSQAEKYLFYKKVTTSEMKRGN